MSWLLRKRVPSQPVASGAMIRIAMGEFGYGSPVAVVEVDPRPSAAIYHYHQGDLFGPGTGNWVFEPIFELPLQTIWGGAFLRRPNTFNPIQPPQVYASPVASHNGIGGIVAGDMEFQPLLNPDGQTAPFSGDWTYDVSAK